jgi:hypothetical protein
MEGFDFDSIMTKIMNVNCCPITSPQGILERERLEVHYGFFTFELHGQFIQSLIHDLYLR